MSKKSILALAGLAALVLTGCGGGEGESSSSLPSGSESTGTSSSSGSDIAVGELPEYEVGTEKAQTALASLHRNNHKAKVHFVTTVYRIDMAYPGEVGIQLDMTYDLAYTYTEDVRGFSQAIKRISRDTAYVLDDDGNIVTDEDGNPTHHLVNEQESDTPVTVYWRDEESGTALSENVTELNEIETLYMSDYDYNTGFYQPIIFDEEFRNPWDYIRSSDILEYQDGSLHLDLEKGNFLVDCYFGTSVNWIDDIAINVDANGAISSLVLSIPDIGDDRYTRSNTMEVTYSDHGSLNTVKHVQPYTHDNPALAEALLCLEEVDNFTYTRHIDITNNDNILPNPDTVGYYTPEYVLFHNVLPEEDLPAGTTNEQFYELGDAYDYRILPNEEDGLWYVYEYTYSGYTWSWGVASLSGTTAYTFPSYEDIRLDFSMVDASVFVQDEDNPLVYVAEDNIVDALGTYFDNPFLGVHSTYLEDSTLYLIITLTDDGKAIKTVETGFSEGTADYALTFTLSDIGTTSIPSWAAL